ncbi:tripartite tricarboxylate transporter substrate binding protein [Roseococcus sp.]|uniref:tripartite tricarboxylate transporter substrate binding protein n=1 Tax=Roseococcus sp. TaxID=2109646 RepID=UPI003BAAB0D5
MDRRTLLAAPTVLLSRPADAQPPALSARKPGNFPSRPIELIVAFPAGGGMDVTARILARHAERLTGHRFVVNNRTGGAGMVAHNFMAKQASPDGYTMGILSSGVFVDGVLRSEGRWSIDDLEIAAFINYDPSTWIVAASGPLQGLDLRAIVSRAREAPDSVRVAMLPQSASEFIIEQVERGTGARFTKVPFQGGIPGMTAMLGGHIDVATVFFSEFRAQFEAGAVRPVGIAGPAPVPNLPGVPTFDSTLGTNGIHWAAWRFAMLPRNVPQDRRDYLAAIVEAVVADPEAQRDFTQAGVLLDPSFGTGDAMRASAARLFAAQLRFLRESGRVAT